MKEESPSFRAGSVKASAHEGGRVLGVDACPAGWVGAAFSAAGVRVLVRAEITDLVAAAAADGALDMVAIDIPIGLADSAIRRADLLARVAAGPRWPSVFLTPVRAALQAETYAEALAVNRAVTGAGISSQAYRLREKILQVDRWRAAECRRGGTSAEATLRCPVVEAHPELSFAAMATAPLADRKATWAGAVRRWQLLAAEGIELTGDLGLAGLRVGVDDVLDAAAVAWTADRVVRGIAACRPDPPERFSDGVDCAIWT